MRAFLHICAGLMVSCLLASWLGFHALAMVLFPIPVAIYWLSGQPRRSLVLILCAALAALLTLGSALAVGYYSIVAALGVLLGLGIARNWRYGWIVAAVTAAAYLLIAGRMLLLWDQTLAHTQAWFDAVLAQAADRPGSNGSQQAVVNWLKEHWAEVGVGMIFWPVLIVTCLGLSLTVRLLSRSEEMPRPRGSFREMRTPEWLVWAAILLAALWFIERTWHVAPLRLVTWNTALALSAVYWVNGVSVLAYAFNALHPTLIACLAVVMLVFLAGVHPVLCFVGLFDTWAHFRKAADKLVAARERAQQTPDDDTYDNHE